jgi:CheY-like chemotaxis protein
MTRILIVDDESDTLDVLRLFLELSGYQPFTTLNSQDALTLAEVENPDCILLDIMMPGLDGFSLCKMMRSHPKTKALPIMFVTAYSPMDLEDRRVEAGADMVLMKPFGMDSLIQSVEKLMLVRVPVQLESKPAVNAEPVAAAAPVPSTPPVPAAPATPSAPAAPTASVVDAANETANPAQGSNSRVVKHGASPDAFAAAVRNIMAGRPDYL